MVSDPSSAGLPGAQPGLLPACLPCACRWGEQQLHHNTKRQSRPVHVDGTDRGAVALECDRV
jgi:hypothetical protein